MVAGLVAQGPRKVQAMTRVFQPLDSRWGEHGPRPGPMRWMRSLNAVDDGKLTTFRLMEDGAAIVRWSSSCRADSADSTSLLAAAGLRHALTMVGSLGTTVKRCEGDDGDC